MLTLFDILHESEEHLVNGDAYFGHGTNNAWDEAVQAASFILGLPADVEADVGHRTLTPEEVKAIRALIQQRIKTKKPLPYLTHEAWFAGLSFYVDERVIIPRSPFGELIQKQGRPWTRGKKIERILDLCTGSGCIAIACAKHFPGAIVDAVDLSTDALAVAQENVKRHGCEDAVHLYESDLFSAVRDQQYDLIISNPPYVDQRDMDDLPKEFRWEPELALAAGKDGLTLVHRILKEAPAQLKPNGLLFVEVGNSEPALIRAYPALPFTWISFDHGGQGVFLLKKGEQNLWKP